MSRMFDELLSGFYPQSNISDRTKSKTEIRKIFLILTPSIGTSKVPHRNAVHGMFGQTIQSARIPDEAIAKSIWQAVTPQDSTSKYANPTTRSKPAVKAAQFHAPPPQIAANKKYSVETINKIRKINPKQHQKPLLQKQNKQLLLPSSFDTHFCCEVS